VEEGSLSRTLAFDCGHGHNQEECLEEEEEEVPSSFPVTCLLPESMHGIVV